jgi:hypothetical protein
MTPASIASAATRPSCARRSATSSANDLARERQLRAAEAGATLAVYHDLSTSLLRIRAAAGPLLSGAELTPLPRAVSRRLVLETTSPW